MVFEVDGQRDEVGDNRATCGEEEFKVEVCRFEFSNVLSVSGEGGTALWGLEAGFCRFVEYMYCSIERGCEDVKPGMGDEDTGCVVLSVEVEDDEVDDLLGEGGEGCHSLRKRGRNESYCRLR